MNVASTKKLSRLKMSHRMLDMRVQLLASRDWLLPREQADLRLLKKRKLRLRDRITALASA